MLEPRAVHNPTLVALHADQPFGAEARQSMCDASECHGLNQTHPANSVNWRVNGRAVLHRPAAGVSSVYCDRVGGLR